MTPVGSNWAGDDHPSSASLLFEGVGVHRQVTALEAAERGWYYRPGVRDQMVPDTRRCGHCGDPIFPALKLTEPERKIRHPLSTQVLLHEDGF